SIVEAKNSLLTLANGSRLIDGIASWWVNLHGHGIPEIHQAIKKQLDTFAHVIFTDFTHQPAVDLATKLYHLLPGNPERIFYSDNGATAVETALKIAIQYWQLRGEKKHRLIAFKNGYHGETFGAMSLSCPSLFHSRFHRYLFEVE